MSTGSVFKFFFSKIRNVFIANSVALVNLQMIGLRRGDIVVALKCTGDGGGSRVLDVRWDTCRRVAELVVHNHQRRRAQGSAGGGVQLKIVTPITAVMSDGHVTTAMDTTKVTRRRGVFLFYFLFLPPKLFLLTLDILLSVFFIGSKNYYLSHNQ